MSNINNEQFFQKTPETRSGSIKMHLIIMIATLGISGYCANRIINTNESSPFLNLEITPMKESFAALKSPGAEKASPLDQYYPAMEKYDQMTVEQFESQPIQERLAFSHYLIDKTYESNTYKSMYRAGSTNRYHIHPAPSNIDNGDESIVRTNLLARQISALQTIDGSGQYDKIKAQKLLSAVYYKTNSHTPKVYLDSKADLKTIDQPGYIATKYTTTSRSQMMAGYIGQEKASFREISYMDTAANSFASPYVYIEFKNYDGKTANTWLMADQSVVYDRIPFITDTIEYIQKALK